jgi:hypothetical protein
MKENLPDGREKQRHASSASPQEPGSAGNAEAFAKELNLDPGRTRTWFDQGFTHQGYGTEVT